MKRIAAATVSANFIGRKRILPPGRKLNEGDRAIRTTHFRDKLEPQTLAHMFRHTFDAGIKLAPFGSCLGSLCLQRVALFDQSTYPVSLTAFATRGSDSRNDRIAPRIVD